MEEHDIQKTAFLLQTGGFFEFTRMAFGLYNVPAMYRHLMESMLNDFNYQNLLIYVDDILLYSVTIVDMVTNLDVVLTCLEEQDLKVKPLKCHSFKQNYLEHVVSAEGVSCDP